MGELTDILASGDIPPIPLRILELDEPVAGTMTKTQVDSVTDQLGPGQRAVIKDSVGKSFYLLWDGNAYMYFEMTEVTPT